MFVGSSLSALLYCSLLAYSFYDYYLAGINEPLQWIFALHWPSVLQLGIFLTLGALFGASLYVLKNSINLWMGRQSSFYLAGACSIATAPLGLVALVGLCLAQRKQPSEPAN